jgi:hypothetical protein
MRVLRWGLGVVFAIVGVVVVLDTVGGYLFDGPLGPIPGGAFVGAVDPGPPDWSRLEKVIELEIRPAKPWSLSVWNVVVDGEVYVPSAMGERRRWTEVAVVAAPHRALAYAPNVIDAWTRPDGTGGVDVFWNVSTWNPYAVVLVRTNLRPGP